MNDKVAFSDYSIHEFLWATHSNELLNIDMQNAIID